MTSNSPTITPTPDGGEIPEGMVPWRGGDSAPADWNGGEVWLRCGKLWKQTSQPLIWGRPYADRGAPWNDGDIVAYTPRPTPQEGMNRPTDTAEAREALVERLREALKPLANADIDVSGTAAIGITSAHIRTAVDLWHEAGDALRLTQGVE